MTTPDPTTPTPSPDGRWDEHPNDPVFDPIAYQAQMSADQLALNFMAKWWLAWCVTNFILLTIMCLYGFLYALAIAQLGESENVRLFFSLQCALEFYTLFQIATGLFLYRALRKRLGRTLCQVLASITCLAFPLGTLLGFFTLKLLRRPSIARSFV